MSKSADQMEVDSDSPKPTTTETANDEDDPIVTSYPVYLNPSLPQGRRLLVLQHPNRTDDTPRAPPTEIRLKAGHGMVEVDMPLDHSTNAYDREKGLKWGKALNASTAAKSGGSHGLAGGFGFGAVQQRGGSKKKEADDDDVMIDWAEAVRQDKVLRTQTLGGQYPDVTDVQYMIGVFQGKNLHLTPVSSLVHLRPQLHHIDATTYLDKNSKDSGSGAGGGGSAGGSTAARAIHMTIKNTAEGETVTTETMADRLRNVQSEPWRTLRYTDENEEAAWEVYNESLFYRPEKASEDVDLEEVAPKYSAKWADKKFLESISGIEKPEPEPEPAVKADPESIPEPPKAPPAPSAAKAAKAPSRPRGGGAAASRRGGAKPTVKSSSTINID